jgi:hypothetical protein
MLLEQNVIIESNSDIINILKKMEDDDISEFEFIGGGVYGSVFGYLDYAIKIFNYEEDGNDDPYILYKLQSSKYYPKLYAYKPKKFMIVERIKGDTLYSTTNRSIKFDFLMEALLDAVKEGFYPSNVDIYNVMLNTDGCPIIVDVGDFQILDKTDENINLSNYFLSLSRNLSSYLQV